MQNPSRNTTNTKGNNDYLNPSQGEKKKEKKYYGPFLVGFIISVILLVYYTYTFEVMLKFLKPSNKILIGTVLLFFHVLLVFLLLSFYMTMKTRPGEIPMYWGFYIGDHDYKRKRYCLICNAFKPERSHHCSVCNTCVLNMDHHCPWVNNCIGFYNRKYFMMLLFYVNMICFYIDFSLAYFVYLTVKKLIYARLNFWEIFHCTLILGTYCAIFSFTIIISTFFKFHLQLVLKNSTTIESLDVEHKEENKRFCLSSYENWIQVFGKNVLLWFIPFDHESGRPEGDGLDWKTRDEKGQNLDQPNNFQTTNPMSPNAAMGYEGNNKISNGISGKESNQM